MIPFLLVYVLAAAAGYADCFAQGTENVVSSSSSSSMMISTPPCRHFSVSPTATATVALEKQQQQQRWQLQQQLSRAKHIPRGGSYSCCCLKSSSADNDNHESVVSIKRIISKFQTFVQSNSFLVGMFVAVALAKAAPALGKNGGVLRPELFIGKYGVGFIFLLSGLSLELSQLTAAISNIPLNALIQLCIFGAWPFLLGVPLTRSTLLQVRLLPPSIFPPAVRDGILILTCLPTTVNMNIILTGAAGGNVATSVCNAVVSNLAGIFVTPALLFRFFGSQIQLPFWDMLWKLSQKVLLPVAIGQVLRTVEPIKKFYQSRSKQFKHLQEFILLSILWNAFCTAISENLGLNVRSSLGLLVVLPLMHVLSLAGVFVLFSSLVPQYFNRGQVVAAMFAASQKTLAFGLPLINTVFGGNANLAAYCAPLMFVHPLQLIIGSLLVPRLQRYTDEDMTN